MIFVDFFDILINHGRLASCGWDIDVDGVVTCCDGGGSHRLAW